MKYGIVMLMLWMVAGGARAEIQGAEVVAATKTGHPRLMISKDWPAAAKAAIASDPWFKKEYDAQHADADRILTQAASKYEIPDGLRLLATSRRVLERVSTLAAIYKIDGDRRYLDRAWIELDAAAKFKDWNPRHFLDTAEMTAAFAIGYDWLYDEWTEAQRAELREAIANKGLTPALNVYEHRYTWWPSMTHNWNIVCNGGIGMGALAIAHDEPELSAKILGYGIASAPNCLKQFAPDGGWVEGPGYWGYTTLYESMFLDSLRTATNSQWGLNEFPGMEKGGWFPAYMNGQRGAPFNFADMHEGGHPEAGAQLLWMAREFHEPRYADYEMQTPEVHVPALELVWGPGIERKNWKTIDTDRYFRGPEVASMRDSWDAPDGWFVGFKAGANGVNHFHLDVGSFVLEAKGVRWGIDLGSDDYNLPGYFGNQRTDYYRLRAEGHNTLLINPGAGPDQNPKGAGKITAFESSSDGVKLAADLTGVYDDSRKVTRHIDFERGKSVTVSDDVETNKPSEIWWFFHTHAVAKLGEDAKSVRLSQSGKTLEVKLLEPSDAQFEIRPAVPLPTSPHPPKQADDSKVKVITLKLKDSTATKIVVRFE